MKANKTEAIWVLNPDEVNAYMQNLDHPLVDVIEAPVGRDLQSTTQTKVDL